MRNYTIGASLIAMLCAANCAVAQEAKPQHADNGGVPEIVVTAQRRSESIQKSSLAVSVINSAAINRAAITSPQELTGSTPGLVIGGSGTAQPYVRGVGNADNTGFAVSGVAFNVDGVYVAQPIAYSTSMFDVSRVEILKGPQGTLYGRNASGGAINILTNDPSHELGGSAGLSVGNYNTVQADAALNVPLTERFMARAAVRYSRHDGYFGDGTGADDTLQGRLKLRYEVSNDLTIQLNLEGSRVRGELMGSAMVSSPNYQMPNPWAGANSPSEAPLLLTPGTGEHWHQDNYSVSGEINWKAGPLKFTLIPAYRSVDVQYETNTVGFNFVENPTTYRESTIEGRVAYEDDRLKLVAGLYYFNQDQKINYEVHEGPIQVYVDNPYLKTGAYAAFSQLTYSVLPHLRLIGGLRYSHELQKGDGTVLYTSWPGPPPPGGFPITIPYSGRAESHATNWKAGAELDVLADSMAYATVSTGFKAGGMFPSPVGPYGGNTFLPEKVTAYEIGLRNRFFNRKLQLNIELFRWEYDNKQETFGGTDGIGIIDNITSNAKSAYSEGVSVDTIAQVTDHDRIEAAFEYNPSKYVNYTYTTPIPSTGCPITVANAGPPTVYQVNCSGMQLSRAPNYSGNAAYSHTFELGSIGSLVFRGEINFAASRWVAVNFTDTVRAPAYQRDNLFLTYTNAKGDWSVTAYVRNLTNTAVATSAYAIVTPNTYSMQIQPPRTYGVQIRKNF